MMNSYHLSEQQRLELTNYFQLELQLKVGSDKKLLCVEELLERERCIEFLQQLRQLTGSPTLAIAASQFAKRYAALFVVPYLYALSIFDKALDASLRQVWLNDSGQAAWKPKVMLQSCAAASAPPNASEEERAAWYDHSLYQLFALHLAPLWKSLAEASSLPPIILWENTAVRIYSLFEKKIAKLELPDCKKKQAQADFSAMLALENGRCFAEAYNPVARFYTTSRQASGDEQTLRVRRTCCLYYLTLQQPGYCEACPRAAKQT